MMSSSLAATYQAGSDGSTAVTGRFFCVSSWLRRVQPSPATSVTSNVHPQNTG
jgi:hypothetical protein